MHAAFAAKGTHACSARTCLEDGRSGDTLAQPWAPLHIEHPPLVDSGTGATTMLVQHLPRTLLFIYLQVYAGSAGGFSKTFTGGPYKHRGLNTGVTKSKVHKLLDDF